MKEPTKGSLARFALGPRLRELRLATGLTLTQVESAVAEISHAKLSRIERGAVTVRTVDVDQLGRLYGADEDTLRELKELARATKAPNLWQSYADVVSPNFSRYIELEQLANAFCWYEVFHVPGLLQTPDFMRVVMANQRRTGFDLSDDKLERRLEVRLMRQEILNRADPPAVSVVLDDGVLSKAYGEPRILAGQLEHFLELGERPNVDIRVMPTGPAHAGLSTGPFIVLDFPEDAAISLDSSVYVDGLVNFTLTDEKEHVELFKTAWADMSNVVLSPRDSADVITRQAKDLRRTS